ncbi:hypothetical protein SAMN05518672_103223 [Chitinophaga sp. CF118]|uniref:hypothetical protein n=1 Tax=Chitinophaga sp. CF118 TaxID=1884367 RepID=UPI0008E0FB2D|nr:hypothetical protein [Chitinophaga sp. CF118]SFD78906.1 hypothetical protein SAMN05518672_103223 [Chitinophaga sp. CF118]
MKTKSTFLLVVFIAVSTVTFAQTVIVTDDAAYTTGAASSVLDVKSTTKGFLAPRMTQAQRIAVTSPAEGLLVYQTDNTKGFYYYTNSAWISVATSGSPWSLTGNTSTNSGTNFLGTSDLISLRLRTNNVERMVVDSLGRVGIGVTNPASPLVLKDTLEIRRVGTLSEIIFSNSAAGTFRIEGDAGDMFLQGGGGKSLQIGSFHTTILAGDRQSAIFPSFLTGPDLLNTGVLVPSQRDVSVPLAIQAKSATQTANLTEWRNSSQTAMSVVDENGYFGIGTAIPSSLLHIIGTNPVTLVGVQLGTSTDSLLTIASGLVKKLPYNTFSTLANSWSTTGNTSTNSGTNFLGTSDLKSLRLRTNNIERMVVDSLGRVGIGTTTPATALHVFATNPLTLTGVQDGATSDSVLTITSGTVKKLPFSTFSAATAWILTGNTGTNSGTNFLGTSDLKSLRIRTNNVERMVVDSLGRIGIGTTIPTTPLHVVGTNPVTLMGVQLGTSSDSLLTISSGVVKKLPYNTFTSLTNSWSTTGNSGTSNLTNFLGTADNVHFPIRTNNVQRMIIDSLGCVAIGTSAFDATNREKLLIDAGTTTSVNAVYAKGSINNYLQFNIQNLSTGTQSSADLVATANNGTETTNFVDLGINGSGYVYQSGNPIETGKANDCYLISSGNDMYLVNNNAAKDLIFLVGGTAPANEAMRILANENVGIATITPSAKLDVAGTFKLGASGSVLNNVIKTSVTISDNTNNITYSLSLTKSVTVTGAATSNTVIVNPRAALPNGVGIAWSRVSATNTVDINFTNTGAGSLGNQKIGNNAVFDITIIQ